MGILLHNISRPDQAKKKSSGFSKPISCSFYIKKFELLVHIFVKHFSKRLFENLNFEFLGV
jgi:hypothetical protein